GTSRLCAAPHFPRANPQQFRNHPRWRPSATAPDSIPIMLRAGTPGCASQAISNGQVRLYVTWRLDTTSVHQYIMSTLGPNIAPRRGPDTPSDRKSTRLNSSHVKISYAVFC